MLDLVFFRPEIPPNTGNAMRLAAVTGTRLHLIEPLGFDMDDARLRRAGMDYRDRAAVQVHTGLEAFYRAVRPERVFAFTVDGELGYAEISYEPGDALVFGPESVGLPVEVTGDHRVDARLRIPMIPDVRSINLANAAAIVVYEAWRQLGFEGASDPG